MADKELALIKLIFPDDNKFLGILVQRWYEGLHWREKRGWFILRAHAAPALILLSFEGQKQI